MGALFSDKRGRILTGLPVSVGIAVVIIGGIMVAVRIHCSGRQARPVRQAEIAASANGVEADQEADFAEARKRMVRRDLRGRNISDSRVLEVMSRVARHQFVPQPYQNIAYADQPLPIGHGQTISQPYVVALMTQLVRPTKQSRALDVGTGSGYQAALLAELCHEVYSIEIVEPLADEARQRLKALGYQNATVRCGDGYQGWPDKAPFDVIIVAAAPDHVPQSLIDQLAPGGRLVLPVGRYYQDLILIEKRPDGTVVQRNLGGVAFVPMTGEAEKR